MSQSGQPEPAGQSGRPDSGPATPDDSNRAHGIGERVEPLRERLASRRLATEVERFAKMLAELDG